MSKRGPVRRQRRVKVKEIDIDELNLLPELWNIVFSHLDLPGLLNAQFVNRSWLTACRSREVWQLLILRAFPHLKDDAEFTTAPHLLLKNEYQYFLERIQSDPEYEVMKTFLFDSLCGDFTRIEDPSYKLSVKAKRALYRSATANGHQQALVVCLENEFKAIGSHQIASHLSACLQGQFEAIEAPDSELSDNARRWLYICAAVNNVQTALDKLNLKDMFQMLRLAAKYGLIQNVEFLISNYPPGSLLVLRAVELAAEYGNLREIELIIDTVGVRQQHLMGILHSAARHGQLSVVKRLFTKYTQQMHEIQQLDERFKQLRRPLIIRVLNRIGRYVKPSSPFFRNLKSCLDNETTLSDMTMLEIYSYYCGLEAYIPLAFSFAALHGQHRVVDYLLVRVRVALLPEDIELATRFAIQEKNVKVMQTLLLHARDDIPLAYQIELAESISPTMELDSTSRQYTPGYSDGTPTSVAELATTMQGLSLKENETPDVVKSPKV